MLDWAKIQVVSQKHQIVEPELDKTLEFLDGTLHIYCLHTDKCLTDVIKYVS